jgi:C-terminal processing protease CtpA/Prc
VSEISDTGALIIDLRHKGGGHPDTVAFVLSYLLDGAPARLIDFVDRNGTVKNLYSTTTEAELPKNAVRFWWVETAVSRLPCCRNGNIA